MSNKNGKSANGNVISTGGNNVIVEMDAENNEDESYYLSQSPIRRGGVAHGYQRNFGINNKSSALSNNPSTFGQGMPNLNPDAQNDSIQAGNQQNQQYMGHANQYSPSSA